MRVRHLVRVGMDDQAQAPRTVPQRCCTTLSTYGRRKNSVKSWDEKTLLYRGFRCLAEIISPVVWLYFRFALSFRDIEVLIDSRVRWSKGKRTPALTRYDR